MLMAHDAIHRIENPDKRRFTGAFHIYMGDYLHSSRSIWYPGDAEAPATFDLTQDIFAAANRELEAARGAADGRVPRVARAALFGHRDQRRGSPRVSAPPRTTTPQHHPARPPRKTGHPRKNVDSGTGNAQRKGRSA